MSGNDYPLEGQPTPQAAAAFAQILAELRVIKANAVDAPDALRAAGWGPHPGGWQGLHRDTADGHTACLSAEDGTESPSTADQAWELGHYDADVNTVGFEVLP